MMIAVRMVAVVLLVVENSLDLSSEKFKGRFERKWNVI